MSQRRGDVDRSGQAQRADGQVAQGSPSQAISQFRACSYSAATMTAKPDIPLLCRGPGGFPLFSAGGSATRSGVPYIVRRRRRSIEIAVLLSIVPGIFWKLVLRL
jgi:hypothetical protein